MSYQKCTFVGNLGADPELKYLPNGTAVLSFNVATSTTFNDKSGQKQEATEWHKIIVWGKRAETCNKYLVKGKKVLVEGMAKNRSWTGKDDIKRYVTEYHASNVVFLSAQSKKSDSSEERSSSDSNIDSAKDIPENMPAPDFDSSSLPNFTADDIPF